MPALLIAGHGSTENPDSSAPTLVHAAEILRRQLFHEVHCCFWKEEPSYREILPAIQSDDIYLVPNFISDGYFTQQVIPREFELSGPTTTLPDGRRLHYTAPVGAHPRMTDLLLLRAQEVAPDVPPQDISLIIVGHGTSLNDNSRLAVIEQVETLRSRTSYAEIISAYMEEPPLVSEWDQYTTRPHVVVVPFFISDGLHSYQDIPVLLGIESEITPAASQRDIFRRNPHHLRGRTLHYASAIGTHPLLADVILDQIKAFQKA